MTNTRPRATALKRRSSVKKDADLGKGDAVVSDSEDVGATVLIVDLAADLAAALAAVFVEVGVDCGFEVDVDDEDLGVAAAAGLEGVVVDFVGVAGVVIVADDLGDVVAAAGCALAGVDEVLGGFAVFTAFGGVVVAIVGAVSAKDIAVVGIFAAGFGILTYLYTILPLLPGITR